MDAQGWKGVKRKALWEGKWNLEKSSHKAPLYITAIRIFNVDYRVEYVLRLLLYKGAYQSDKRHNTPISMLRPRRNKSNDWLRQKWQNVTVSSMFEMSYNCCSNETQCESVQYPFPTEITYGNRTNIIEVHFKLPSMHDVSNMAWNNFLNKTQWNRNKLVFEMAMNFGTYAAVPPCALKTKMTIDFLSGYEER